MAQFNQHLNDSHFWLENPRPEKAVGVGRERWVRNQDFWVLLVAWGPTLGPRHRAVLAEASTAERLCRGTTVLPEERGPRTREVVRTHGRGTAERRPRRRPAASGRVPEWTHSYVGLYRSGPLTPTNQAWRERLKNFF